MLVAYQKSFVACKAVHYYWNEFFAPQFPSLAIIETEVPYCSPYVRKGKTKKLAAVDLDDLDFIVHESERPLFHIELKAGPGSIDEMIEKGSEWQLDINDSNDIIGAVKKTRLPAYIFHVQLDHKYRPPTRCTVWSGMWFTDIFTLLENRLSVKSRRDEQKAAGYYRPSIFRPIEFFPEALRARHYLELQKLVDDQTLEMT